MYCAKFCVSFKRNVVLHIHTALFIDDARGTAVEHTRNMNHELIIYYVSVGTCLFSFILFFC
jgi:hypothetical protein